MQERTRALLKSRIPADAIVLDIGGWADPFERADWMLDFGSYDTRGLYDRFGWVDPDRVREPERFTKATWVQRDACDRSPFPFEDNSIDFVICAQTLEDIRDPVWVCAEMARIGRAGYIEVPSRLEEQSWGVAGEYVGHAHHAWVVDAAGQELTFTFKPHDIHSVPAFYFPPEFHAALSEDEKVERFWWQDGFSAREHIPFFESSPEDYFGSFVSAELRRRGLRRPPVTPRGRASRILRRAVRRKAPRDR